MLEIINGRHGPSLCAPFAIEQTGIDTVSPRTAPAVGARVRFEYHAPVTVRPPVLYDATPTPADDAATDVEKVIANFFQPTSGGEAAPAGACVAAGTAPRDTDPNSTPARCFARCVEFTEAWNPDEVGGWRCRALTWENKTQTCRLYAARPASAGEFTAAGEGCEYTGDGRTGEDGAGDCQC